MINSLRNLLAAGLPVKHSALGAFNCAPEKATALLLPVATIDLLLAAIAQQEQADYKINSAKTAAVSLVVCWNSNMKDCPRGVKLQLLGAGGVGSYSAYHGDEFWVGWAPMPKRKL